MTWFTTLASYGVAYLFLSVCVGLVVGRVIRTMAPMSDIDGASASQAAPAAAAEWQLGGLEGLFGDVAALAGSPSIPDHADALT